MTKVMFIGVFGEGGTNDSQARALERKGVLVYRYHYRRRGNAVGADRRDLEVVALCREYGVDLVILSKCNGVAHKVVGEIQQGGTKVAMWYMDINSGIEGVIEKSKACDFVFCGSKTPGLRIEREADRPVAWVPEGFDPEVDHPVDVPFVRDAAMIGSLHGRRSWWHEHVGFEVLNGLYGEDHSRAVCQTKVNLNFTTGEGCSDRLYRVLACGGFLLTQPWDGMNELFSPGADFGVFDSPDELREKMGFYAENEEERASIAARGFASVQRYSRDSWAESIIREAM